MEITDLTKGYLEAEGWVVRAGGRDLQIAARPALGGEEEYICVWTPGTEPSRGLGAREGAYQARFKEIDDLYPGAQKFMVVESLLAISREFLQGARKWFNVRVLTPAQFFDTAFKWEESSEAASAVRDLSREGESRIAERVDQPYEKSGEAGGQDLLDELCVALRSREARPICIVVGPAGAGKSFLFEALFFRLYDEFIRDKQAQVLSARPFPLLPQHLARAASPTMKSILDAYLSTEFARPLAVDVFEWRLTHGMGMWLIDGLDEVISQDPAFFEYLVDLLTQPDASPPRILICIRDSLLATNDDFRLFTTELSDFVEVYRLKEWDAECKRQYATIRFGRRAEAFVGTLTSTPGADELSAVPFYCGVFGDLFEANRLQGSYSEASLLDQAISAIIQREYDKRLLDENVVVIEDVREFAEAMAAENFENAFGGVPVSEARELAQVTLPENVGAQQLSTFIERMTQLALFAGGVEGQLRFAQELVEHYLLGSYIGHLSSNSEALVRTLSARSIPSDWITLRVAADRVREASNQRAVLTAILEAGKRDDAFRNLVQLAAYAASRRDAFRDVSFERRNLTGLVFEGIDLVGASFRDANLTECLFRTCDLQGADFEGAILRDTSFLNLAPAALRGAVIGNLAGFYSIVTDGGPVDSVLGAAAWFEARIGVPAGIVEPCDAALQLRHIFQKLVRPDGRGGRDWLGWKALLAGKRHSDPEKVARAAVRHGYLTRDEGRDRVLRPGGERLNEIAAFVAGMRVSPGLVALLDDACPEQHHSHVPLPE